MSSKEKEDSKVDSHARFYDVSWVLSVGATNESSHMHCNLIEIDNIDLRPKLLQVYHNVS